MSQHSPQRTYRGLDQRPSLAFIISAPESSPWRRYLAAIAVFAAAAVLDRLSRGFLGPSTPFFCYFPAVIAAGVMGGFGPGVLTTVLGAAAAYVTNMSSGAMSAANAARLACFVGTGALISALNSMIRDTARQLSEGESRFRLLVQGVRDYAIVVLDVDGIVRSWNAGAQRIKGYEAHEIIGRSFEAFYPPEIRGRAKAGLRTAAEEGRFEEQNWRLRKDGTRFWAHVVINSVRDERGKLLGFSKVVRDLTDRKAMEDDLRRKDESLREHAHQLEQAVAGLEAFSYTVSHDLRAPLRAIEGYAYHAVKRSGDRLDAETRHYLERIKSSAVRMDRLIRDVLAYSRTGRADFPPAPVDLDAAVEHVAQNYAGRDRVTLTVRGPLGRVMGQESLVTQCVSNLVENAVKFARPDVAADIQIASSRANGRITLSVTDNGIGIEADARQRIFEPFVRLHATADYEGTGIGLAIVRKAVERMGGRAGVESEPGRGSRFWIELTEAN